MPLFCFCAGSFDECLPILANGAWSLKTRDPFSHVALTNQLSSKRNVPDASLRCLLTHRDTSLRNFSPRAKKKTHDEVRTWGASASYVGPPRGPFPAKKKIDGISQEE